eukprot:10773734-Lingulodinium_polyedra.AAC.1
MAWSPAGPGRLASWRRRRPPATRPPMSGWRVVQGRWPREERRGESGRPDHAAVPCCRPVRVAR